MTPTDEFNPGRCANQQAAEELQLLWEVVKERTMTPTDDHMARARNKFEDYPDLARHMEMLANAPLPFPLNEWCEFCWAINAALAEAEARGWQQGYTTGALDHSSEAHQRTANPLRALIQPASKGGGDEAE